MAADEKFIFWDNAYIGEPGQFKPQIPFMITAFGDIFVWVNDTYMNEDYAAYINIKKGTWTIITTDIEVLFNIDIVSDKEEVYEMFDLETFPVLDAKLGLPAGDECYGYVPALVFGGDNDVDKTQRVKSIPYIDLMCQSLGKFEFVE